MSLQIRIQPDRVREIANLHKSLADRADAASNDLKEIMVLLDQAWDGVASESALNSIEGLLSMSRNLSGEINKSADRLSAVARIFESADSNEPIAISHQIFRPIIVGPGGRPTFPSIILPKLVSVRIVPEEVRDVGNRCKNMAVVYSDIIDDFYASVQSLEEAWEGKSYNKYLNDVNEFRSGMNEILEALPELAESLIRAANRFEEIDNSF